MKGQCSRAQVHSEKEDLSAELQELDQQLRAVAEEQEDVHTKIYGSEWTPGYAQSARTLLEMLPSIHDDDDVERTRPRIFRYQW